MAGSTCCVPLINGYLNADNDFMDDLHADGAVAGFFCYPLDTLREKEGTQKIFDFRDKLEELFTTGDGPEVLTLTGGATGLYCGYVDFIAWDIQTALQMAKNFFEDSDIPWASFHTFRREAGTVNLKTPSEEEPDDEDQAPELDETLAGMDYIPYTPQNEEEYFQQLEQWNDEDEYTRCIQALNAIPENWRNYRTAYALARALENYAIIGDHDEGTLKSKGDKALLRAIEVLESVREEGQDKAEWNMRMAYGYQYLYGQEEKAIPYAERWAELDPEDENAPAVIRECKAEIRKRQRSRKKKAKFVPGDTPFEGFDLTNFWDDNWYALKEYVSDPPSDELIASVEEELGYKLPAAYIWLMKQHNGGIPVNTCYPCDEPTCWADDHVAITGIFGIGREKSCSLCGELGSQFMIDEWEYPAIGVAICDCPSAGHDMIFLDYRACGPQGEPAVVHVDQENDYKITHLADSFEEFVRGLEHESLYDPDEDVEDLEDDADEEKTDHKGSFAGSVLLSKAEWDKEQLIRNLREEWGIVDEEPDEGDEDDENSDDAVVMRVGGMMLIVTLFHGHIPDNEAEINAENNYMWPEAVVPGDTPFEGFDLTNFWDDNWYALKEYVSDPPSDELIASVEEELGYKLPAAYIWLMKQHNGGIPVNTCYPCDEPTCWADDHVAITGIFGIGREKSCSLCGELGSQFMIDEWEYPAIGVAICDCPSAGHDMIFLDYRACGPQGEPAVVHVDQENDYKITHLADSFEEFVRGLEHESLYDPDEDVEDLEDDADEEKTDHKGSFAGSVLLSKAEWDKEQLIRNLREEWGIVDEEPDEGDEDDENSDDAVVMRVGGMMLIVTLFHGHIPDNEAEINAENNYMWPEAVVPGDTPFEGFDLTNFWDDNWYALKEYVSDPPSDELIASVEEELGYKLPAAYIWLMKQHNGGIPVNTCYPCDEPTCWADDHVAITGIFGIGREKSCSLCGELGSQFMIDEWEYPAIGVAICDCPSAGHDMIFLDYRACGPQGEPAVVHVDQENDYKITHLADSFEEFVRGLEHESLYDPDEDVEDLEDDADEEKTDHKGSFAGSVLLSKAEWDKEQLIRNLREEWGIVDEEPDEGDEDDENSDDAVVMRVGGMMLIVTLFHGHIPDNEAEINAENNYMWPEAGWAGNSWRSMAKW